MDKNAQNIEKMYQPIQDPLLLNALNELSRSINIVSTYGNTHPAVEKAAITTGKAMQELFAERKKLVIGAFNGVMTVDEIMIKAVGTLLISLERRLVRLRITGLKIQKGITEHELNQLIGLLAFQEPDAFLIGLSHAEMAHITSEDTRYEAVREGETVAHSSDLIDINGGGILILEDESSASGTGSDGSETDNAVQVNQIVAFLKGDTDVTDEEIGEELAELAKDPSRLGKLIMESVAIRQSASQLSGESLSDIILGCLRRTYNGLRKQPAFKTTEGMADLQKALLLLEETMLDKMRALTGDPDPELDRQIVQTIRQMDESIGFELAAKQYMEHREAIAENKKELQNYIKAHGAENAHGLLSDTDFPSAEWRKIVVDSGRGSAGGNQDISTGLNTLATVFEKLESVMRSESADGSKVRDLLGQANDNLDDTIFSTKGKLEILSKQLKDSESGAGTIGGQGRHMNQEELLAALAEVAQELMQPLTAINASLEMMLHGYVGEVTEEQQDMLSLASNSGEHLKFLMNMLVDIVGCPTNKGVDSRFHTTSEIVISMKSA